MFGSQMTPVPGGAHSSGRITEPSWNVYDTGLVVGLWILAVAASRTILSWDSYLYLSSAKSLFSTDIGRWYQWIREPLYPLQIRISTALFGPSDLGVIALQATIVVVAVAVFSHQWFRGRPWMRRTAMVLIIANPIVLGFIGFVGQQAVLLALICATGAWIARIADSSRSDHRFLVASSAVLGVAWVLSSALFIPVVVSVAGLVWLAPRWSYAEIRLLHPTKTDSVVATTAAIALVLSAAIAITVWWGFKAVVIADTDNAYTQYHPWIWDYRGSAKGSLSEQLPQKILAFLAIGPDDIVNPAIAKELIIFGGLHPQTSDRCGVVTSADPTAVAYTEGFMQFTCRPAWASRVHHGLAFPGFLLYRISLVALFTSTAAGVFWKRFRVFSLLTLAFLLPYLVGGLGISRYAVPLYPLGVAAILTVAAPFFPAGKSSKHVIGESAAT